jgi:hypothetical protein
MTRAVSHSIVRASAICAVAGAVLCIIAAIADPHRAAAAYVVAYVFATTVVLGALATVMIAQLTAATWFVVLRRTAEGVVAALPALAILALPLLAWIHVLYPWANPDALPADVRTNVAAKAAYLNVPFFIGRTIVYWIAWLAIGELVRRASLEDTTRGNAATRRLRVVSAIGVVVFALTITFAAIDWLMSLTPGWSSTVYAVYVYGGAQLSALALLAVLTQWRRDGALSVVNDQHIAALAKLMLTFVLFWVYMGYSQLIVVWSGDLPREVSWYVPRVHGWGGATGLALIFGHFALPFLVLLPGVIRRNGRAIAALGAWLLVMHWTDIFWLVVPSLSPAAVPAWWMHVGALLLVVGASVACAVWRAADVAPLPAADPRLEASLRYAGE